MNSQPKPKLKLKRELKIFHETNKAKPIKCIHCGFKWKTKSIHLYVTCPHCLRKTPNPQ